MARSNTILANFHRGGGQRRIQKVAGCQRRSCYGAGASGSAHTAAKCRTSLGVRVLKPIADISSRFDPHRRAPRHSQRRRHGGGVTPSRAPLAASEGRLAHSPSLVRPPRSLAPCPPSRPALRGERRHLAVKMDASRRLTDGSGPTLPMRGGVTREWRWPVGVLMEDRLVEHCLAVSYTASSCTAATGEAVRGGGRPSPRRRVPLQSSSHV